MKYRRKPQTVDAVQWTGEPFDYSVTDWLYNAIYEGLVWTGGPWLFVPGRQGHSIPIHEGDYIVRLEDGTIRGVPRVEFERDYEVAE